jgi:hypothetical protein
LADNGYGSDDVATVGLAPYTLGPTEQVIGVSLWVYAADAEGTLSATLSAGGTVLKSGPLNTDPSGHYGWAGFSYTGSLTSSQLKTLSVALTYTGGSLHGRIGRGRGGRVGSVRER